MKEWALEKVCVFIDGSNFYFSLKRNNRPTRVDYYQLSLALAGPDRQLYRTFYYNASYDKNHFPDKAKTQMTFLDSLDRTPFLELRLGRLVPNPTTGATEKGVDVLMASDMVYQAFRGYFDTAVVVTENSDFTDVIEQVKNAGKHVEIANFTDGQTRDLIRAVDTWIPLDQVLTQYAAKIFPAS